MKRLDLVTGNFCHITSIHFTNVHKHSSWDRQFKLLISIQVYHETGFSGVTLIGHGCHENFFFRWMIIACGFLTSDFKVM